jgi:hypothetical protein
LWDKFVEARRNGTLPGCGAVRNRVIEYDLKFLIAVLGWAEGAKEEDRHHLVKNPGAGSDARLSGWKCHGRRTPCGQA